ncbi:MAG TPA: efflux RND transporter periplasmic adaptor subunit [Candidatus Ozemobacteraceae bacterium]|nr:efflux RND transporter periplasmic adaptor subunit [Candidatus Ozemobacteraceae bacterium]
MNRHIPNIIILPILAAMILNPLASPALPPVPAQTTAASVTAPVVSAPVPRQEPGSLVAMGELIGEVGPMRKVALAFKVSGRIERVPLFAGDAATAAAPIAMLEPRDFELSVEQAAAALEAGRARLRQLETGARPEEKRTADENLKQSQANWENAKADLARNADLFKAGALSKQALDAAEAKAKVTEAQYLALRAQKALVDQGPRLEEKDVARATIRQQEASLQLAKQQLEYATLRAPFAGVVAQRHLDEGAYVTPAAPVFTFMQVDPVKLNVECPERFVPALSAGLKAIVTVDALPGRQFTGILERTPAAIDSKTRSANAEIIVSNPESILKPGMFARVKFLDPAVARPEQGGRK